MSSVLINRELVENAIDQLKKAQLDVYVPSTQSVIDELEAELAKTDLKVTTLSYETKSIYDHSFPNQAQGWRCMVEAREFVGWKDFYFLALRMQKETANGSNYKLGV